MKFLSARKAVVGLLLVGFSFASAWGGECKLRAQLVWGTDGEKPDGKDLPELEAKLKGKLSHFRWKNYWVVKSEDTDVSGVEAKKATLGKCAVELRDTGKGQLEVKLFNVDKDGKLKHLRTVTEPMEKLQKGGTLIVGGDSKDTWNDAWMVVITVAPPAPAR